MNSRNVTLSLPDDLLRDAKVIAARQHTSVSALLTELLTELVEGESRRRTARAAFEGASKGMSLGTGGRAPASRDALHAR